MLGFRHRGYGLRCLQWYRSGCPGDIVLQRQSLGSYDVLSHQYTYNGQTSWINRIKASEAFKYVTSGLPFSRQKIAIGGGIGTSVVTAFIALAIFAVARH